MSDNQGRVVPQDTRADVTESQAAHLTTTGALRFPDAIDESETPAPPGPGDPELSVSVPTGVTATPGNGFADVSWNPVPEPGVGAYRIYRGGNLVHTTASGAVLTWRNLALTNGVTYSFQVSAVLVSGEEGGRSEAATVTPAATALAAPTAEPEPGSFTGTQSISLTAGPGTTIRYTLDGSTPTAASLLYSAPISLTQSTTIRAIAMKDGNQSPVAVLAYTITAGVSVAPPNASMPGGTYSSTITVSLSAESGATIRYTLDGSIVTNSSTLYTGPLTFSSTVQLKARAFKDGVESSQITRNYAIEMIAPPPAGNTLITSGSADVMTISGEAGTWVKRAVKAYERQRDQRSPLPNHANNHHPGDRRAWGRAIGSYIQTLVHLVYKTQDRRWLHEIDRLMQILRSHLTQTWYETIDHYTLRRVNGQFVPKPISNADGTAGLWRLNSLWEKGPGSIGIYDSDGGDQLGHDRINPDTPFNHPSQWAILDDNFFFVTTTMVADLFRVNGQVSCTPFARPNQDNLLGAFNETKYEHRADFWHAYNLNFMEKWRIRLNLGSNAVNVAVRMLTHAIPAWALAHWHMSRMCSAYGQTTLANNHMKEAEKWRDHAKAVYRTATIDGLTAIAWAHDANNASSSGAQPTTYIANHLQALVHALWMNFPILNATQLGQAAVTINRRVMTSSPNQIRQANSGTNIFAGGSVGSTSLATNKGTINGRSGGYSKGRVRTDNYGYLLSYASGADKARIDEVLMAVYESSENNEADPQAISIAAEKFFELAA